MRKFFDKKECKQYNFVNYIDEEITKMLSIETSIEDYEINNFNSEDFSFIEKFTPKRLLKCQDKVAISALLVGTLLQSLVSIKKENFINNNLLLVHKGLFAGTCFLIGASGSYLINKIFTKNKENRTFNTNKKNLLEILKPEG